MSPAITAAATSRTRLLLHDQSALDARLQPIELVGASSYAALNYVQAGVPVVTVAAIFQVGMNEYDSGYVFLPLEAAQIFFQK